MKKENYLIPLFSALIAALSAIFGSWITAEKMIKGQKLQNEQALEILTGQNAEKELNFIREKALNYFNTMEHMISNFDITRNNSIYLNSKLNEIKKISFELMFYAPIDITKKALKVDAKVIDLLQNRKSDNYKEKQKDALHGLIEWQIFTIHELYRYKKYTMPTKTEIDDFVNILKQILNLEQLK